MEVAMAQEDLRLQVMMAGGRRCGKTSILAAMMSNFEDQFEKTHLTFSYDNLDTLNILEEKNKEINDYFIKKEGRTFTPDNNPTEEMIKYSFSIGITDKRSKIRTDFVDYPGEWLTDKEHQDSFIGCVQNSQAIIIAIDTPHMMEEGGQFNENRNFCHRTCETLKMALEKEPSDIKKLFLFVPLKCERYMMNNQMNDICNKTKVYYNELIKYLARSKSRYEVAITPVFTLGGAAFSHFERDKQTHEIKINEKFKTPENPIYYFPDDKTTRPEPKHCEQPVVYLLSYIMQMAIEEKENRKKGGPWKKLSMIIQEQFFNKASLEDYESQRTDILKRLKKNGDGYDILQNPMKF